ncbi:hypothetical protein CEXT_402851 [Caerostris extrusa]|uniref:Uncharacterized protein n=1 Tax=Caerostris extrusa TaxID=172846 RepID=A0AAV4QUF2_CAEEX|nr:hypothetical protein CEXT_402851 [Caerostris extrusa]
MLRYTVGGSTKTTVLKGPRRQYWYTVRARGPMPRNTVGGSTKATVISYTVRAEAQCPGIQLAVLLSHTVYSKG